MKITRAEVEKVARLSRLALSEEEMETILGQMDAVLGHVELLNELDTDGITPMAHAVPLEKALANAPNEADGCFGVPKVIE
ncbi:MAG: Asp-tRNA(Asn)/Glu-tRNA(Gln) amidotransferase subunit GatC [Deltaproteobacteria bacterium]|nr:Asp-tRNA(Asn)/Glu-tRNA(Gln) amidotransferase subunit GatC [Deltaproteobacteria bacterium]